MALRDTLQRLQHDRSSAQPLDKSAVIQEWQKAVASLMATIQTFLQEYSENGTIAFVHSVMQLTEEPLGAYQIPQMALRAGPAVLMAQPIGRMVAGATGRVDLYRQGHGAESQRVMLLRDSAPEESAQWRLLIPPKDRSFEIMDPVALRQSLQRIERPLTKENLEVALDRLLQ